MVLGLEASEHRAQTFGYGSRARVRGLFDSSSRLRNFMIFHVAVTIITPPPRGCFVRGSLLGQGLGTGW